MNPLLLNIPDSLQTQRLIIRSPRNGEAVEINAAAIESFDALHEWMIWAKDQPSLEDTELYSRTCQANFILRKVLDYRAYLKSNDTFAGCLSLFNIDWTIPKFEIGYWLRTSLVGQGYITEAAGALAEMAATVLSANRLEIRCDETNVRSAKVAQRLGFQFEGILRNDSRTPAGELRSTRVYAISQFA